MFSILSKLEMLDGAAVLSASAVITTIFQYLSGALVCRKYIRNRGTGDASCFPFVCGFLSCCLWLKYGVLTNETAVIVVNSIGATLFLSYVMLFWAFTMNKRATLRQLVCAFLVLALTLAYTQLYEQSKAEAIEVVGYLCCLLTVVFFAAPCCMLMRVMRLKSTEMLPLPLILMSFFASLQWYFFGLFISDLFLQIPNFLGALLSALQLSLFYIYPSKPRSETSAAHPGGDVPYAIFN